MAAYKLLIKYNLDYISCNNRNLPSKDFDGDGDAGDVIQ